MASIYKYCTLQQICYPCFKEDQQDPVKLYLGLCYICDKDRWYSIKSSISTEYLTRHINSAPKEWAVLYEEELKARS